MFAKMIKYLNYLYRTPGDIVQILIGAWPGPLGFRLRYAFWKKRLKFLGNQVKIDIGVHFQNPQYISIDDKVWIDKGVIIIAGPDKSQRKRRLIQNSNFTLKRGEVHIGKSVHIGPYTIVSGIGGVYISDRSTLSANVKIYSFSHHYKSDENPSDKRIGFGSMIDNEMQFMIEGPVFLGRNVGVAITANILPGVSIRQDSFVKIGSVVNSSFEENSLIAGNPAERIKERYKYPESDN
ncbi:acyltransferase [Thermodesulfobacteriota bacterium]